MDNNLAQKIEKLPQKAGVYFFKDANEAVIYVGKAKNLKKRVKNHFQKPDQHAFDFISQISDIDFIQTDSENNALLLEQQFIKKLQPRWNVEWKDDKNYFYIALTNDLFPRIYLTHQPSQNLLRFDLNTLVEVKPQQQPQKYFGPFVSGREVKSFLREIRKAIPYRTCRNLPQKPCLYANIGLCLAPCEDVYKRKKSAYAEMIVLLEILIKIYRGDNLRIECYDISNLSGTLTVGSMVVFENGKANKNQYRKFKIKTVVGQNDVASLAEVLRRRLKHSEWPMPDLIVLDGGKGQLKAAKNINIPTIALAKIGNKNGPPNGEARRTGGKLFSKFSKNYSQLSKLPKNIADLLLQIRDEAHRFAITYNKSRRQAILNPKLRN